ncbi:hypothetical protein [Kitasatospora sp. NPDC096204]|uniref:hypothetical protein n=1 Tax=Kitasatospora sp. NPDC096204 TaxID=3364094 RepID=UPI00380D5EDA
MRPDDRGRLLVALSFGAWTRRSELAALNLADVRVSTDPERPGLHVRFRKSKTDQAAKGAEVFGDFFCERCGREAARYQGGVCGNCVLAERLGEFLNDGTGSIRVELVPFYDEVRNVPRPKGMLTWVGKPHVQQILQALAHGQVPLSHEGLSTLSPWRSVAHVRDLLMHSGVLPYRDRHLLLFERRLPEWLDAVENPEHRTLLHRFATWHVLHKL